MSKIKSLAEAYAKDGQFKSDHPHDYYSFLDGARAVMAEARRIASRDPEELPYVLLSDLEALLADEEEES